MDQSAIDHALGNVPPAAAMAAEGAVKPLLARIQKLERRVAELENAPRKTRFQRFRELFA